MRSSFRRWLPLALIVAVAAWLRSDGLALRPMHADEANQAVKFGELLEQGGYAFDPRDHHGPTLYYCTLVPAWLRGEENLATLTETTVRLTPAFFGVVGVLLTALLAAPVGRGGACAAASLLAVSPAAVYYSRYFIQETLLVTFTLGALVCAARWWATRRDRWALAAGAALGLMQATKESAPVFVVAAGIAATVTWPRFWAEHGLWRALLLAAVAALVVAVVFYSSFGHHLAGLADALATYGVMIPRAAGGSGHDKPWGYYLNLFLFRREGGLVWDQTLFLLLGLIGGAMAWRVPSTEGRGIIRFVAVYTALVAVALSLTPYKTPWLVVNLAPGMAMLAAYALAALATRPRWGSGAALGLFAVVLGWQAWQTRQAAFLWPADSRNPYAYAHTSPDVLRIQRYVAKTGPTEIVKVIGREYWPLPWYLRGHARTGYWASPPEDCDGALVICSPECADIVRTRLRGRYREDFLGLRPGVILVMFTAAPAE